MVTRHGELIMWSSEEHQFGEVTSTPQQGHGKPSRDGESKAKKRGVAESPEFRKTRPLQSKQ